MTRPTVQLSALETRVASRRLELIAEIIEHKKNSCRSGAGEAIVRLQERLGELAYIMKDHSTETSMSRLDDWMAR